MHSSYGSGSGSYYRHHRPRRVRREVKSEPKLNLPKFSGGGHVEEYLEWEMKVDHIFMCNHLEEERKIALASMEFEGYAMMWWH